VHKIDNFSEMKKVLSIKSDTNNRTTALFGRFGIEYLPCHLSMEKRVGIGAVTLIVSLCLFEINSLSIFSACHQEKNRNGQIANYIIYFIT